jgi:hypothetical protein
MRNRRSPAWVLGAALSLSVGTGDARACACCTNIGQRYVGVQKFDAGKREDLERLRFASAVRLYTGEADPADVQGIVAPTLDYELHVAQEPARWVFDFRDKAGNTGTLTLALPASVSIFEVDPRGDTREGGLGPALYKEWTLTAKAAGTGIFAAGLRSGASISLILHGQGNSCTSSGDFSHWTLTVKGPKAAYSFIGELVR